MSEFIIVTRLLGEFKHGIRHLYIKDYFEIRDEAKSHSRIIFYPTYAPWHSDGDFLEVKETVQELKQLIDTAQGK